MLRDLKIATRLTLGFGLVIALLTASLLLAIDRLAQVNTLMQKAVDEDMHKVELANQAALRMNAAARYTYSLFLSQDRQATLNTLADNREAIRKILAELKGLLHREQSKVLMEQLLITRQAYASAYGQVSEALSAGQEDLARQLMEQRAVPALNQLLPQVQGLVTLQEYFLKQSAEQAEQAYQQSRMILLAVLAGALALAVLLALWIIRSITTPLGGEPRQVQAAVERIASGDLSRPLRLREGDQHSLMAAMHRMQNNLREMLSQLASHADGVAGAALQLAAASKQINSSSAEQSAASTGMATTMEQISVSIAQVSSHAGEALSITGKTSQLSQQGGAEFHQTVGGMQQIARSVAHAAERLEEMGEHTRQISTVVQLIRSIAEQTNLLALNAAIEAARAGEQGRGFAVVADEVRQLAERTAQATLEIGKMIELLQGSASHAQDTMSTVVEQVGTGVSLAERSGQSLRHIGEGAARVLAAVEEISQALGEQNSASEDIAQRIEQIAQMSEENHQAIGEVMDTAHQLEQLAAQSLSAVQRFQL